MAERIICYDCSSLKTLNAPRATEVNISGCYSLTNQLEEYLKISRYISSLAIQECTQGQIELIAQYCSNLKVLEAENSTFTFIPETLRSSLKELNVSGNDHLRELNLSEATKVSCCRCFRLKALDVPQAIELDFSNCHSITTLNAPKAKMLDELESENEKSLEIV